MVDLRSISALEMLGWAATCVFTTSYFFSDPKSLRRVQMLGAAMWLAYGALLGAYPVMVANLLSLSAMAWTARRNAARPSPELAGEDAAAEPIRD